LWYPRGESWRISALECGPVCSGRRLTTFRNNVLHPCSGQESTHRQNEGRIFFQNVGKILLDDTASHIRKN
jgi:hypothetical protein